MKYCMLHLIGNSPPPSQQKKIPSFWYAPMILFQTKQERFKASLFEMMFNYLSENLLQSEL